MIQDILKFGKFDHMNESHFMTFIQHNIYYIPRSLSTLEIKKKGKSVKNLWRIHKLVGYYINHNIHDMIHFSWEQNMM